MDFFSQNWLFAALASTLVLGVHSALFKLPSTESFSKYQLTVFSSFLATILGGIYAYSSIHMNIIIVSISFLWAFFYIMTIIAQMKSLEYIESSSIFPFTSLLSNIFVVIIGIIFWNDHFTPLQIIAICAACVIFFFHSYRGKLNFRTVILPLFLFIAIGSTLAKNTQKYGSVAGSDNLMNFVFWQMLALFVFSLLLGLARERKKLLRLKTGLKNWGYIALFGFLQLLASILMVAGLSK